MGRKETIEARRNLARTLANLEETMRAAAEPIRSTMEQFAATLDASGWGPLDDERKPAELAQPTDPRPITRPLTPDSPILKKPRRGVTSRLAWFRYKLRCDTAGVRFTHREMAAVLDLEPTTCRNYYSRWKKKQKK